jgi:glutathione S-transferase
VYCDTPLIARVLESLQPEPALFHASQAGTGMAAARWFDRELFLAAISQLFDPAVALASAENLGGAEQAAAFVADRTRMMGNAPVRGHRPGDGRALLEQILAQLEAQLAACGPYLYGAQVGWTDFCAYHPLWALQRHRLLVERLAPYPELLAWLGRMRAFGHGQPEPLVASDALALARASLPRARVGEPLRLDRSKIGDQVEIAATDYALEPSVGRLVHVGPDELVIEREDERAGLLAVHFPRLGFRIKSL